MLSIRCKRVGRRNLPHYKIIVIEKARANCSKCVETIGWYNPGLNNKICEFKINQERLDYWIEKGAKCSSRIHYLLGKNNGIRSEIRQD